MIRSNFLRTMVTAALIGFIDIKALVPRSQYEVVWVSANWPLYGYMTSGIIPDHFPVNPVQKRLDVPPGWDAYEFASSIGLTEPGDFRIVELL